MVAAVSDTAITLAHLEADGTSTPTAVSVTTTTSFTKQTPAPAQAIVAGKCLAAQGAKDNSGVLQATAIELQPCPPLGGHRHHIPHYRRG
ncbi:hypothetical protein MSM1_14430 [Mycobacterium sp. SM1]|uniref:hypothetical protein n=1 Tax=Mycobacterium sp. SM1 TaxID=2816243 RepID=UPI001BCD86B9|nr:hypothetical protein [Mycobacterium sp. SM1]MBS4729488.1 hypothetical protein [Mycobacterium sp. SM1]